MRERRNGTGESSWTSVFPCHLNPMKCTLCDRTALWQVGKEGYCRAHKAEAYAAEAMKNQQRHRAKVERETLDKMGHIADE